MWLLLYCLQHLTVGMNQTHSIDVSDHVMYWCAINVTVAIFHSCEILFAASGKTLDQEGHTEIKYGIFRSTPMSRPKKAGLSDHPTSIITSVHFSNLNIIWYVDRG